MMHLIPLAENLIPMATTGLIGKMPESGTALYIQVVDMNMKLRLAVPWLLLVPDPTPLLL